MKHKLLMILLACSLAGCGFTGTEDTADKTDDDWPAAVSQGQRIQLTRRMMTELRMWPVKAASQKMQNPGKKPQIRTGKKLRRIRMRNKYLQLQGKW